MLLCTTVDSPLVFVDFFFFLFSPSFYNSLRVLNDHFLVFLFHYMKRFRCPDFASQSFTVGVSVFHEFASRLGLAVINRLSAPDADSQLWPSIPDKAALYTVTAF